MYLAVVALTMFILPIGSIVAEAILSPGQSIVFLVGRWFVFWAVGVRLGLAGMRQLLQPQFTAQQIFHMEGDEALAIVRELGIANLAIAVVGLVSVALSSFVLPAALYASIFFGIAGVRHGLERNRSRNETIAMVSDLFAGIVLVIFVCASLGSRI